MSYFKKRHRKFLFVTVMFLITVTVIYIFAPYIDGVVFRRREGNLEDWIRYCNNEDSGFLMYDGPYWYGGKKGKYTPSLENDVAYSFDGVIKLEDGVYITGLRGLTNWVVRVRIYSRKNCMLDVPVQVDGEYRTCSFYMTFQGNENSDFPFKRNTETVFFGDFFKGNAAEVYLASPKSVGADGMITLLYNTGKNFSEQKEIKIPVEQKSLK